MKLYYSKGACSLAVRILINELNIPCEFESVNLVVKKTERGEDFLTINPKGAVPVLVLDNNEVLTENAAIQQYIADKYKAFELFPPVGDFNRYRVIEWLNFISTDLHKGCSPLFNPEIPDNIKDTIFKKSLKGKLKFVDAHLTNNKYLMGDNFSLADGYLFVILRWLTYFQINLTEWPQLSLYHDLLETRHSIVRSLREEGLMS